MKLIFVGTSEFALTLLKRLAESAYAPTLVVTQPDRPRGRGRKLSFDIVKQFALEWKLPLFQPENINAKESVAKLYAVQPDVIAVASYGKLLKKPILTLPRRGCFNLHASLLPKYRGAAPVAYAILNGEIRTGVTLFRMSEKLDAGAMVSQKNMAIPPSATTGEMEAELARLGAELFLETLPRLEANVITEMPQDDTQASYAPKLTKENGRIDWSKPAEYLARLVLAMQPYPMAYCKGSGSRIQGSVRIIVLQASAAASHSRDKPGTLVRVERAGIRVACGEGTLSIERLQLENRKSMSAQEFLNGYRVAVGDVFS